MAQEEQLESAADLEADVAAQASAGGDLGHGRGPFCLVQVRAT
jgi:hypothetical protein